MVCPRRKEGRKSPRESEEWQKDPPDRRIGYKLSFQGGLCDAWGAVGSCQLTHEIYDEALVAEVQFKMNLT